MTKELKEDAIKIKGRDYVMVKDRIKWLDENHEGKYSITSEYDYYPEKRLWVVKSTLKIFGQEYTGLAQEIESDDYRQVNATSALENCQTSAIGRAIALINVGVIDSLASYNEMQKAMSREERIKTMPPLHKAKGELVQEFFNNGVSNFKDQKKIIKDVLNKETVDSIEEAEKVTGYLKEMTNE